MTEKPKPTDPKNDPKPEHPIAPTRPGGRPDHELPDEPGPDQGLPAPRPRPTPTPHR